MTWDLRGKAQNGCVYSAAGTVSVAKTVIPLTMSSRTLAQAGHFSDFQWGFLGNWMPRIKGKVSCPKSPMVATSFDPRFFLPTNAGSVNGLSLKGKQSANYQGEGHLEWRWSLSSRG
jgi:hypothetical protein